MIHWISVAGTGQVGLGTTLFLLLVAASPSRGSVILFSDKTAWLAGTAVSTTIGFEGIAPTGGTSDFSNAAGLNTGGVNFLGQTTTVDCSLPAGCSPPRFGFDLLVSSPGAFDGLDWGSGAFLVGPQSFLSVISPFNSTAQDGTLTAHFPTGTTAIGFDLMSRGNVGSTHATPKICLSTGDCFDITTPDYPGRTFVGFTSSGPLDSAVFTIPEGFIFSTQIFLDNVAVGAAVPEPGSLSMLGLAVLFVVGRHARKIGDKY
jgi:hypothetical protein